MIEIVLEIEEKVEVDGGLICSAYGSAEGMLERPLLPPHAWEVACSQTRRGGYCCEMAEWKPLLNKKTTTNYCCCKLILRS